jgi:non-specific serine/threonine protein kinase
MRAAYDEAVEIARDLGDAQLLAAALLDLSFVPYIDQDPDRAEEILREGLAVAEQAEDRILMAEFWSSIGFLEAVRGNPVAAMEIRLIALDILREEGAHWKLGDQLGGQAMLSRSVGDLDAAKRYLREAAEIFVGASDMLSVSMASWTLALIANDEGHHERAARLVGAGTRIREQLGGGVPPELGGRWGDPEADARKALGDEAYERAWTEGYALTTEEAISYLLEEVI